MALVRERWLHDVTVTPWSANWIDIYKCHSKSGFGISDKFYIDKYSPRATTIWPDLVCQAQHGPSRITNASIATKRWLKFQPLAGSGFDIDVP